MKYLLSLLFKETVARTGVSMEFGRGARLQRMPWRENIDWMVPA